MERYCLSFLLVATSDGWARVMKAVPRPFVYAQQPCLLLANQKDGKTVCRLKKKAGRC